MNVSPILDAIVANKRIELLERQQRTSESIWKQRVRPSRRSLKAALQKPRASFILECKKVSPSQGTLREDFEAQAIAAAYRPVADAVSVLTDQAYFGGTLDDLQKVSDTVDCPVLCKDFILEPYQIYEARGHGADAVLLMLSVLDDAEYLKCAEVAQQLEMDCLVEVHTEAELERALRLGASILGINNRDLRTLEVDLETTRRLAPQIPSNKILVCESGIQSPQEVRELSPLVDGFLVGSALVSKPDVALAARELTVGRVKVCGITSPKQAQWIESEGAIYGGLIFVSRSSRCVSAELAEQIVAAAPLRWVGVFEHAAKDEIETLAAKLGLCAVQLHGNEDEAFVQSLRLPAGCEVWKTLSIPADSSTTPQHLRDMIALHPSADRVLFDTAVKGKSGGTGQSFDWNLIETETRLGQSLLSGGIGLDNVEQALSLGAFALDVNSGVESQPGQKDQQRLAAFFRALRPKSRQEVTYA